ncbi:hypothetical protein BASA50_007990 [Batrachochytrium salamandrivorans]|uniref:SAP domain-containing protein n=1 Tax=Batrachochytrium salamandrivorans TaxID=1357716 RepID=A0ABQ8F5D2_9FUNG|nr:hypothetical protein BASA50_007990 [Batrachochytrium salamandrivorans]
MLPAIVTHGSHRHGLLPQPVRHLCWLSFIHATNSSSSTFIKSAIKSNAAEHICPRAHALHTYGSVSSLDAPSFLRSAGLGQSSALASIRPFCTTTTTQLAAKLKYFPEFSTTSSGRVHPSQSIYNEIGSPNFRSQGQVKKLGAAIVAQPNITLFDPAAIDLLSLEKLESTSASELKNICRSYGLLVSGTKQNLVTRIMDFRQIQKSADNMITHDYSNESSKAKTSPEKKKTAGSVETTTVASSPKKPSKTTVKIPSNSELEGYSYDDLRKLCKELHISATGTKKELISRITEYQPNQGFTNESSKVKTSSEKKKAVGSVDTTTVASSPKKPSETTVKIPSNSELEGDSYDDLRKLCSSLHIPATGTKKELISRITEYQPNQGFTNESSKAKTSPEKKKTVGSVETTTVASSPKKQSETTTKIPSNSELEGDSYEDLRKLCSSLHISAKGTKKELISRITEYQPNQGSTNEPSKVKTSPEKKKAVGSVDTTTVASSPKKPSEMTVKIPSNSELEGYLCEDLRKLCSSLHISAKGTKKELISRITEYQPNQGFTNESSKVKTSSEKKKTVGSVDTTTVASSPKKQSETTTKIPSNSELEGDSYEDLRKLCSSLHISAKGTKKELISRITEYQPNQGFTNESSKAKTSPEKKKAVGSVETTTVASSPKKQSKTTVKIPSNSELEGDSYEDLRKLCSSLHISAKGTKKELISRITEHQPNQGSTNESSKVKTSPEKKKAVGSVDTTTVASSPKKPSETTTKIPSNSELEGDLCEDLRKLCKELHISAKGTKKELISRITEHQPNQGFTNESSKAKTSPEKKKTVGSVETTTVASSPKKQSETTTKIPSNSELEGYLCEDLRKLCKELHISAKGTKKELISRITEYQPNQGSTNESSKAKTSPEKKSNTTSAKKMPTIIKNASSQSHKVAEKKKAENKNADKISKTGSTQKPIKSRKIVKPLEVDPFENSAVTTVPKKHSSSSGFTENPFHDPFSDELMLDDPDYPGAFFDNHSIDIDCSLSSSTGAELKSICAELGIKGKTSKEDMIKAIKECRANTISHSWNPAAPSSEKSLILGNKTIDIDVTDQIPSCRTAKTTILAKENSDNDFRQLSEYTVPELSQMCKERGIRISGTKKVLMSRIEEYDAASDVEKQILQSLNLALRKSLTPEAILASAKLDASVVAALASKQERTDIAVIQDLSELDDLKFAQLKQLCLSFGITPSGSKLDIVERLYALKENAKSLTPITSVLGVDVGTSNLGFAHVTLQRRIPADSSSVSDENAVRHQSTEMMPEFIPTISDWGLLNPDLPVTYIPRAYTETITQLIDRYLFKKDLQAVLIERQSWRPIGARMSIPHAILRTNAFEAIMIGIMAERGRTQGLLVDSISSRAVSEHFMLPSIQDAIQQKEAKDRRVGASRGTSKSKINTEDSQNAQDIVARIEQFTKVATKKSPHIVKKMASVAVVKSLLNQGHVACSPELRTMFDLSPKKDDMCDSLLNALAYLEWSIAAQKFANLP